MKLLFGASLISAISSCWNIRQVSSANSNSSQSTAYDISFIYNWKKKDEELHIGGFPGSETVFLIWTLNFLFDR